MDMEWAFDDGQPTLAVQVPPVASEPEGARFISQSSSNVLALVVSCHHSYDEAFGLHSERVVQLLDRQKGFSRIGSVRSTLRRCPAGAWCSCCGVAVRFTPTSVRVWDCCHARDGKGASWNEGVRRARVPCIRPVLESCAVRDYAIGPVGC